VLSGEAVMEVDSRLVILNAGEGIWIRAGTAHQMRNDSNDEVHFLVISQPPSHGDRENT
jgi:mannose-6-phosphate isomerase-like protein (cupin superfamily)